MNQLKIIYIANRIRRRLNNRAGRQLSTMNESNKVNLNNSINTVRLQVMLTIVVLLPWLFLAILSINP